MAVEYSCCGLEFFVHVLIIVLLLMFAGMMSALTLGLMSTSLVDLEVLAKSGTPKDRLHAVNSTTGYIDYDKFEEKALDFRPRLIISFICGGSAYPRDWDYARFRSIADKCGALLLCDMAHISGLVAAQGVQPLWDGVLSYLPCTTEVSSYALDQSKNEEKVTLSGTPDGPLVALAFKLEEGRFG